jgi:hypothetical protein
VRAGLRVSVAAAFRGVTAAPIPAGSGLAPLADVPDGERRDGYSQLVVRREYSVIPILVGGLWKTFTTRGWAAPTPGGESCTSMASHRSQCSSQSWCAHTMKNEL